MKINIASRLATKFEGTLYKNFTSKTKIKTAGVIFTEEAFKDYMKLSPTKYKRERYNSGYIVF